MQSPECEADSLVVVGAAVVGGSSAHKSRYLRVFILFAMWMLLNINRASEKVSPFYVCDNLDVIQF